MTKALNAKVSDATYIFNQHYNRGYINVVLDVEGGGCCQFTIPPTHDSVVKMFLNEFDIHGDDEFDIRKLKGMPVIAHIDNNGNGKIIAISNFMDRNKSVMV